MVDVEIIAPVVNINGTSKKELLDQHMKAHQALCAARLALVKCSPHGRDFQTVANPDVYTKARDMANLRVNLLDLIIEQVEALAHAINDQ